ncbi:flagellar biosynthesis regulator FlhF domain protein, partial [Vibrio parahaemolyticus AQ3810]
MKIKRFFAKDMRSALLQVKEELGADAVIMSNKKVAGGVAIVAAVDNESNPSSSSASSQSNRGASQSNRYNEHRQMSSSAADRFQDRSLDEDKISLQNSKEKSGSMTQRF